MTTLVKIEKEQLKRPLAMAEASHSGVACFSVPFMLEPDLM